MSERAAPGDPWSADTSPANPSADPRLLALFVTGRAHDSSFDLRASPLSAFLYRRIGEAGLEAALPGLREFASGRLTAMEFLKRQSPPALLAISSIAWATSRVAVTRTGRLADLSRELATAAARPAG